jgi:hypothetical protein
MRDIWPRRRPDGSVSIAARFSTKSGVTLSVLRSFVERWLETRPDAQRAAMERDLADLPRVAEAGVGAADIVIHTRPERGYWARDWLVVLTRATETAFPNAVLIGFGDIVAGKFRPVQLSHGTLERQDDSND